MNSNETINLYDTLVVQLHRGEKKDNNEAKQDDVFLELSKSFLDKTDITIHD